MARQKLEKKKIKDCAAHIVYLCTNMHRCHCQLYFLVDVLNLTKVDKQKTPLCDCSVMRGSLITTQSWRVFHFTAGQKEQAIKFRSSETFTYKQSWRLKSPVIGTLESLCIRVRAAETCSKRNCFCFCFPVLSYLQIIIMSWVFSHFSHILL